MKDNNHIMIRPQTPADHREVEELTRDAFWDVHVPGCNEHYLVHQLRQAECCIAQLDLVAVADNRLVGNIMYSRARIMDSDGNSHPVLCFGPLSVDPAYQNMGIGGALIGKSIAIAKELGHKAVIIYGDPDYYCRFGFRAAELYGIRGQEGLFCPALLAYEIVTGALEGVTGTFLEDPVYHLDEAAATQFDLGFPSREKGFKPSQLRFQELLGQSNP